tara:strand:- start:457 stop:1167 length:711 start_codon:yes stop_codon:yes gene_type:complete
MLTSRLVTTLGGDKFRDEYSIHFDDDNGDFISFTETLFSVHDTAYSFSFWCKRDAISNFDIIFGNDAHANYDFIIFDTDGDRLMLEGLQDGNTATAACSTVANTWYHFVVVSNGDNSHLMYQDGVELDPVSDDLTMNRDIKFDTIGGSSGNTFNGNISDVAIYNTALTEIQVKELYNSREPFDHKSGSASGNLIHWWRMGDGTENGAGTTVYDLVGSLDGTMTNMDATDYEGDVPS